MLHVAVAPTQVGEPRRCRLPAAAAAAGRRGGRRAGVRGCRSGNCGGAYRPAPSRPRRRNRCGRPETCRRRARRSRCDWPPVACSAPRCRRSTTRRSCSRCRIPRRWPRGRCRDRVVERAQVVLAGVVGRHSPARKGAAAVAGAGRQRAEESPLEPATGLLSACASRSSAAAPCGRQRAAPKTEDVSLGGISFTADADLAIGDMLRLTMLGADGQIGNDTRGQGRPRNTPARRDGDERGGGLRSSAGGPHLGSCAA